MFLFEADLWKDETKLVSCETRLSGCRNEDTLKNKRGRWEVFDLRELIAIRVLGRLTIGAIAINVLARNNPQTILLLIY